MNAQCFQCKWLNEFGFGCKAFPEEIPFEITEGQVEHNEVRDDQIGEFVFEPIDEKNDQNSKTDQKSK